METIADVLKLDPTERSLLLDSHAAAPLSPFQEKQRDRWAKAKEAKATARDAREVLTENELLRLKIDRLEADATPIRDALVRVLELHVLSGSACECGPADDGAEAFACELCEAMRALGVSAGWVSPLAAGAALLEAAPELESSTASPQDPDDDFGGD